MYSYISSVLIILTVYIYQFSYMIKFVTVKSVLGPSSSYSQICVEQQNIFPPVHLLLAKVNQAPPPSCFSYFAVNKSPFWGLFPIILLCSWEFLLGIFLVHLASIPCLEFLSTRKLWHDLWTTCVLEKLCSGMSYSAVGQEFSLNESAVHVQWGVFKERHA